MKIERLHPSNGPRLGGGTLTATIETPAERAFSTTTLDQIDQGLGRVSHDADSASVDGGDGLARDVDGYVTQAEAKRFLTDFATAPRSKQNAATLLQLFTPQTTVDVALPKAIAPIQRRHTLDFPDGTARLGELPAHLQAAAHVALDVAAHVDRDDDGAVSRSRFAPGKEIHLDDIETALDPEHLEHLRHASNDVVARPAVVAALEQLRDHISTSSTTKDFVPNNPPEYVARMPLQRVALELVTFGSLENALPIGPAGRPGTTRITPPSSFDGGRVTMAGTTTHTPGTSQQYLLEVNRYFQLQAPEGLTVVLKTETPGATIYGRAGLRTSEAVLDGNGKKQDLIDLAGIAEGAPTTLIALVFDGKKLVESAQIKLPANPITAQVTDVGLPRPTTLPSSPVPANLAPRQLHGVTVTVPALLAALESLPRGEPLDGRSAKVLVGMLKTMSPDDRAAALTTFRALARSREGEGTAWRSPDLGLLEFREVLAKAAWQPLTSAVPGHLAFVSSALIGEARPVSPETMTTLLSYVRRLCVEDEKTGIQLARDVLLFSPKELSLPAMLKLQDFLRFVPPQPHLSPRLSKRIGLSDTFAFSQPGKITPAGSQHRRMDSMTLYTAVNVALPTRGLRELMQTGATPLQVVSNERFSVTARYDAPTRHFVFELLPAAGQAPVTVRSAVHVALESLPMTDKLAFEIE